MNFTVTATPTNPNEGPNARDIVVVDPMSRKIRIPREAVLETRALQRQGVPSLCLLFLAGRCRQGAHCHQAHADSAVVMKLREEALQLPTCCGMHGDINSTLLPQNFVNATIVVNGVKISMENVAFTQGLSRVLEEAQSSVVNVAPNIVCRLHAATRCRYSEDCKFIHICRDVIQNQLARWVTPLIPDLEIRHSGRQMNTHQPQNPTLIPDGSMPPSGGWIVAQQMADGSVAQMYVLPAHHMAAPPPQYGQIQHVVSPQTQPLMAPQQFVFAPQAAGHTLLQHTAPMPQMVPWMSPEPATQVQTVMYAQPQQQLQQQQPQQQPQQQLQQQPQVYMQPLKVPLPAEKASSPTLAAGDASSWLPRSLMTDICDG